MKKTENLFQNTDFKALWNHTMHVGGLAIVPVHRQVDA